MEHHPAPPPAEKLTAHRLAARIVSALDTAGLTDTDRPVNWFVAIQAARSLALAVGVELAPDAHFDSEVRDDDDVDPDSTGNSGPGWPMRGAS